MANNSGFGSIRNSFSRIFLGSEIDNPEREQEEKIINKQTLVAIDNDEAADLVDVSHHFTAGYMSQFDLRSQAETINEYRSMVVHSEVDKAVDDIINEAVTSDADVKPVELELDETESISVATVKKIKDEFDFITGPLLKFDLRSYEIFKQFYVDGRLYYHKIIDPNQPKKGILKVVNLDPRYTKKVKEILTETDPATRLERIVDTRSYFLYDPSAITSGLGDGTMSTRPKSVTTMQQAVELAVDTISFVHSGILSGDSSNVILSHLEKARKPLNNLRMLEDAAVIYRITRAPERRIFYVDVGTLPKKGAEEYMTSLINKYRTKLVYDGTTGKVKGNSHQVSMMEDYWLPRREGGRGTEISTLPAGENLNQIEDLRYFQKNCWRV